MNAPITDYLVDINSNSSPDRASWENLYKVGGKLGYQDTDSGVAKVIQPGNVPAVARGASRFSQTEELFTVLGKYVR